jgi:rhodanese-related sulfurtransferase
MSSRIAIAAVFAASLVSLAGCKKAPDPASVSNSVRELHVVDVAPIVKNKSGVLVDANGPDTRRELGVIPGAILLSDHKNYALSELPPEKSTKLVFYCGGTQCRASDSAADKAAHAGYTDVSVLRDGIRGWKTAGQPTDTPRS